MLPVQLTRYVCAALLFLPFSSATAQLPSDSIPPLVDSLIQLSRSYTGDTEFDDAFTTSKLAGEAAVDCCGEESAAYAAYCFNEGRIRYFMNRNQEAIPWYIKSRDTRARVLGTADVEYGKSCNNLAIAYDVMGRYEEAEPLYLEALAIREATAGKESGTYLNALSNLASMYKAMGEYETAEGMTLEILESRRELLGESDPYYAQSLINLGNIRYETFNWSEARRLYLEALAIIEQQEEIDFYTYVNVLDNLGAVHENLGKYDRSRYYYQEAAVLNRDILGKNTSDFALSLTHLASVALRTVALDTAELHLQECLGILEEIELQESVEYGLALLDQSKVYFAKGNTSLALTTIDQAIEKLEQSLSIANPQYLFSYWQKAVYLQEAGDYPAAAEIMRHISQLESGPLRSAVRYMSDQELANFTLAYRGYLAQSLRLANDFPAIADLCYDRLLLYKGFLLNNAVGLRSLLRQQQDQNSYRALRGLHRQLSVLYASANGDTASILSLESEANLIEKSIVRGLSDAHTLPNQVKWQDVQQSLAENEAAIEFTTYETYSKLEQPVAVHNAALVLLPDHDRPLFVYLGTQDQLRQLLLKSDNKEEGINALYDWSKQGEQLNELVWGKIAKTLEQASTISRIYYSKTGLLHRINLEAIPTEVGRTLAQAYQMVALGSTRELLQRSRIADSDRKQAVLFGGISYGEIEDQGSSISGEAPPPDPASATRDGYDSKFRGYDASKGYWQELPWTEVEVNYADELLRTAGYSTALKMGADASEAAFLDACNTNPSPAVIHLATHGFFFESSTTTSTNSNHPLASAKETMVRSGLILADGNLAWANRGKAVPSEDDGILTAFELSQLDLPQTDLVILSACETGLGEIQQTEGVYGLQRALKLAGVRYVIMSLWQVPDYQAQAFMSSFYLAWLEEEKTIPEAFRNAQAYMRARYKNAYEWAGFVLLE